MHPGTRRMTSARSRADAFCRRFNLSLPVLEGPLAGANAVARSVAIANAGGMGALGALLSKPDEIMAYAEDFRARSAGALQINLWIPDPPPKRDAAHEAALRAFLAQWGPPVPEDAGSATPPDFFAQCEALVAARPTAASSIMGLYPESVVRALKDAGIAWFATATTLSEARAAEAAGADAIVAQAFEAGGHRGAFDNMQAERQAIGMMALIPRLASEIRVPIIAAGGIGGGAAMAAALTLGASAVQIGTILLPTEESATPSAWSEALARTEPEDTQPTRAFSGRLGRAIATDYVRAAAAPEVPKPAPYPVQRGLTAKMRGAAAANNDLSAMQAWAGQAAWMAKREPAGALVSRLWRDAQALLP